MPLKMRKFTATLVVEGQVEAESFDEAERIAEGCIATGAYVEVTELSDGNEPLQDGSNIVDQMFGKVLTATVEIKP